MSVRIRSFLSLGAGLLTVSALAISGASAQSNQPNQPLGDVVRGATVTERARPDYDPIGVRLGSFFLLPALSVQESYNSNIFATERNEQSDFITSIEPKLDLRSNWNNHALNLHADTRVVRFADFDNEDFEDYTLAADGRLDVQRDFRLFGGAAHLLRHEQRSSPNNQGGAEPTEYNLTSLNLGAEKQFNRVATRLNAKRDYFSYDDVRTAAGATIDQGDRDREQTEIALRTGYEFTPLREVYLLGAYNFREYDRRTDRNGLRRDSDGYMLAVGAEYDLTGVTFLDAFVGYMAQDYDDPRLRQISGWTAGAKLTWNVTQLTTITGSLARDVEETILNNASGYFATRAELRADHELLRNLLLNASIGYENDEFEGISRDDDYYLAGIGAKYLMNRFLSVSGGYGYRSRESSQAGADFDENVVFLRLTGQL
jgi:hypothetical protein